MMAMSLTDDDKQWVINQLAAQLEASEARVETRLLERLEKVETTLLAEFHKWASPLDKRVRSHTAGLGAIDADLELLRIRVEKLEQK
jgi:hypothetical protein